MIHQRLSTADCRFFSIKKPWWKNLTEWDSDVYAQHVVVVVVVHRHLTCCSALTPPHCWEGCWCDPQSFLRLLGSLTQVKVSHSRVTGDSTAAVGASVNACLLWMLTFAVASWSEMVNLKQKNKLSSCLLLLSHAVLLIPTSSWVCDSSLNLLVCQDGWASATEASALRAAHGTDTTDVFVFFPSRSQVSHKIQTGRHGWKPKKLTKLTEECESSA